MCQDLQNSTALFPAAFRITKSSQQFLRFPAFSKSFTKHLALLWFPLLGEWRTSSPHQDILCFWCMPCYIIYQKSVPDSLLIFSLPLAEICSHTAKNFVGTLWELRLSFQSLKTAKPILSHNRCCWTYGTAEGTCTRTKNVLQIFMSLSRWVGFL